MRAVMESVDYAFPGLEDTAVLTGLTDPDAILDYYLALGPRAAVLKIGEAGAYPTTPDGRMRIPGFPVAAPDATGTGGAFLARILAGDPPETTARLACDAAALKCTGRGAVARSRRQPRCGRRCGRAGLVKIRPARS